MSRSGCLIRIFPVIILGVGIRGCSSGDRRGFQLYPSVFNEFLFRLFLCMVVPVPTLVLLPGSSIRMFRRLVRRLPICQLRVWRAGLIFRMERGIIQLLTSNGLLSE